MALALSLADATENAPASPAKPKKRKAASAKDDDGDYNEAEDGDASADEAASAAGKAKRRRTAKETKAKSKAVDDDSSEGEVDDIIDGPRRKKMTSQRAQTMPLQLQLQPPSRKLLARVLAKLRRSRNLRPTERARCVRSAFGIRDLNVLIQCFFCFIAAPAQVEI